MVGRRFFDYASPGMPRRRARQPEGELVCFFKLIQYLIAATVIGSIVSVGVACIIDLIMS
jgi:hypothetical protein